MLFHIGQSVHRFSKSNILTGEFYFSYKDSTGTGAAFAEPHRSARPRKTLRFPTGCRKSGSGLTLFQQICPVPVAASCFKVPEFRELTKVALGCGGGEAESGDNIFSFGFLFAVHIKENIDQFIGHFPGDIRFIDHFLFCGLYILVDIGFNMMTMQSR